MRAPFASGTADDLVRSLAERQYGVVARDQLFALGLESAAIEWRLSRGRLHAVHRGVYSVGRRGLSGRGHWLAAVLAVGPGAVLSHRTAAALWELGVTPARRVDVTVHSRSRRNRPGIAVHLTRELLDRDRTRRAGIPVTSVARTLLDLAEVIPKRRLERAVEEAERLRLFDLRAIDDVCERGTGRRGLGALRAAVEAQRPSAPFTRSELERILIDLCRENDLPRPLVNHWVCGFEVDAVWPEQRLVVEVDGYEFHRTRAAFERDRARDAALQVAGFRVLRFTRRGLERERDAVAPTLRGLLRMQPQPRP
jgi:very-short-patch-repair endonuclease